MSCHLQKQPVVPGRMACTSVQLRHMGLLSLPQLSCTGALRCHLWAAIKVLDRKYLQTREACELSAGGLYRLLHGRRAHHRCKRRGRAGLWVRLDSTCTIEDTALLVPTGLSNLQLRPPAKSGPPLQQPLLL